MRQQRSSNYAVFNGYGIGNHCLGSNMIMDYNANDCLTPTKKTNIDSGGSRFIRYINFAAGGTKCPGGTSSKLITVTVQWAEGRCGTSDPYCAESKLISCFTAYNVLPPL
jgi:hypothetical protein